MKGVIKLLKRNIANLVLYFAYYKVKITEKPSNPQFKQWSISLQRISRCSYANLTRLKKDLQTQRESY